MPAVMISTTEFIQLPNGHIPCPPDTWIAISISFLTPPIPISKPHPTKNHLSTPIVKTHDIVIKKEKEQKNHNI